MPHPRTALVTGGSRGIGHRVCRELIRQGTFVVVHAPAPAEAHAAVDRLVRDGAHPALVHAASADFRRLAEVSLLARRVEREFGRLDLLVNNAGALAPPGPTGDGIDATCQINYVAPYALTRLLAPALNAAAGRIVMLTSTLHRGARLDPGELGRSVTGPVEAYSRAQLARMLSPPPAPVYPRRRQRRVKNASRSGPGP